MIQWENNQRQSKLIRGYENVWIISLLKQFTDERE